MPKSASKLLSAAVAALFLFCGQFVGAAVPVEESVEEPIQAGAERSAERQSVRSLPRSRKAPPLDIPPTIEPQATPTFETVDNSQVSQTPQIQTGSRSVQAAGSGLADMFYQMQILQQEIQDLRGQVEEQAYTIQRLQDDQKQQYLDLDRRVAALGSGGTGAAQPAQTTTQPQSTATDGRPTNERDAYRQAFEAMRGQQFEVSKTAFQSLISSYPNGQYTPNAFYWLGEIFLVADQDAEQARQSFMQVVNLYPDHQKTPDALYKLGVVHAALGDNDTARRFLDRVQRDHPDSSAAGLARKYIAELP